MSTLLVSVICFHLAPLVPIIDGVGAMALSLFAFWVDITLLTDGGQTVTLYIVSGHVCGCVPSPTVGIRYIQECMYMCCVHIHTIACMLDISCTITGRGQGSELHGYS